MGWTNDPRNKAVAEYVHSLLNANLRLGTSTRDWVFSSRGYAKVLEALAKAYPNTHPLILLRRIRLRQFKAPLSRNLLGPPEPSYSLITGEITSDEITYFQSLEERLRKCAPSEYKSLSVRSKVYDQGRALKAHKKALRNLRATERALPKYEQKSRYRARSVAVDFARCDAIVHLTGLNTDPGHNLFTEWWIAQGNVEFPPRR